VNNPYRVHAFVCLGGTSCPSQGSEAVWAELKRRVKEEGLGATVRVNKAGCMSQCGHGPMLCVYPQDVWYGGVELADLEGILAHLKGGPPHAARLYTPIQPGSNQVPNA